MEGSDQPGGLPCAGPYIYLSPSLVGWTIKDIDMQLLGNHSRS
jgi:hypothetical protein